MSTALELVKKVYAAFGAGDLPALLAMCRPDVRWQFIADRNAPYTATVRGRAQVGEWFASVAASDDIHLFEPVQMLEGSGHVTVIGRERTTLRSTGKTFECPWIHVFEVEGGEISSFWGMLDSQAAGEARRA